MSAEFENNIMELYPGLYLGNQRITSEVDRIKALGITHIMLAGDGKIGSCHGTLSVSFISRAGRSSAPVSFAIKSKVLLSVCRCLVRSDILQFHISK